MEKLENITSGQQLNLMQKGCIGYSASEGSDTILS